jgi:alpha-glucosidase
MRELRAVLNEYPGDRVLVGEDEDVAYHGTGDDELHLLFNFPLMRVGRLTPAHIRSNQAIRISELPPGAWPCNTLGNHDSPRVWSRYGDGIHDAQLARVHLALVLTLKGTPFLYYGEEIGMTDLQLTDLNQFRDTAALRQYRIMTEKLGVPHEEALKGAAATTRDRCRSPMQWSSAPGAGFSSSDAHAWLPVNLDCFEGVNVAAQQDDENSLLDFYRRMLHLRRETPALTAGDYHALRPESEAYFAFLRHDTGTGQTCLIALNFPNERETAVLHAGGLLDGLGDKQARLLFSTHPRSDEQLSIDCIDLEPFEVLIIELV